MFKHLRPVWAEVNLDNLAYNMKEIKKLSKSKDIMAVVKADAYGHGAINVASTLLENGATGFAVAVLSEAIELRRSGIESSILILGFTPPTFIQDILRYNIQQTIYSYEFAKQLSIVAKSKNKIAKIHVALDTGMGRIGYLKDQLSIDEIVKISELPNIKIEGVFSHFSSADEKDKCYTKIQIDRFNWFCNKLKERGVDIGKRHISNSAGIIDLSEYHFEVVRPGIILYGYYPSDEVHKEKLSLRPVMSLKTNVVHVKKVKAGEYIGYGRVFKTERESLIATLPVGYADGYSRLLTGKAKVLIKGEVAPIVGKICMDQCMVDITNIKNAKVGEEVILIGEDGNNKITAEEIGELIGTISYEILCVLGKRVPRVYIKEGNVVQIRNYI